jgi:hypothetical protein
MSLDAPPRPWAAGLLALVCSLGCGNIDSASRCQLDYANGQWTTNNLDLQVTDPPKCPVALAYPGTNKR